MQQYSRRDILRLMGTAGIVAVSGHAARIFAQDGVVATTTPLPVQTAITTLTEGERYPYLSGGTVGMSGDYSNPFVGLDTDVSLTCSQTLGPCYADVNQIRQDVTEEKVGLPMRLMFRLIEASTSLPLVGASVEIWHADTDGVYSGETPSEICNGNDPEISQEAFMRGIQYADEDGVVSFDTVYPGWYSGRAPHIHIRVGLDDAELLVTQIYFPDELSAFIYETHEDYDHRPNYDTTNADDGVISEEDVVAFVVNTERMDDGALLGYISLGLRSSTDEPLCSVGGSGGGPGGAPGGPRGNG